MPSPHRRTFRLALLLPLVLLTGSLRAGPLDDLEQAMLAGDYARAVALAEALVAQHPDAAIAHWHLGCARSRAGDGDGAIEALLRCAALGFSGTRSVRDDDDLDPVRAHPRFGEVVAAVERAATRRREAFQAEARKAEPTVVLPPRHDATTPTPLVIVLHGTGGSGKEMARAWSRAARRSGAILVAPDALRPAGAGYAWTYRDEAEWYVLELVRQARERWAIDRVVLAGFSQGANIALMLGQSHAASFDAVLPVAGHYEADVATLPTEGPRPRWGLVIGAQDPWAATYRTAEARFREAGMTVRRIEVPGLGHAMPRAGTLQQALEWALAPAED